jgi:hypothetical protein
VPHLRRVPIKRATTGDLEYVAAQVWEIDGQDAIIQLMAPPAFLTILDEAGAGVSYMGEAAPGTGTDEALWRIRRITESAGDVTVEWADGDSSFDNVWDDRAGLTYG